MTPDVLDRLRASNPLPHGSNAPKLETVLARLPTVGPASPRFRPLRVLVPVLAVAVTFLVLIGALGVLHAGHHAAVSQRHVSAPPATIPAVPRDGMRGLVSIVGAGFSSSSDGVISVQQCLGCLADGNQTPHSRDLYWLARTVDGGRNWTLTRERYSIQQPLFVGQDGWAGGLQATGPQAAGIAEYYVTHDGGRTWSVAPAAAPNEGGAVVSVGGGEAWATGLTPTNLTIMHAPVTGSRLRATVSQPIHGGLTNVHVFAGGPGTAYVSNAEAPRQTFVTHDDGRSWQRIQSACPRGEMGGLVAAYGDTVWAECYSPKSRRQVLSRSENGGRSWQQLHPSLAPSMPPQPVSTASAWALSGHRVLRTTDGGLTWSSVWFTTSQPPSLRSKTRSPIGAGFNPLLIAESPTSASLVTAITSGGTRERAKHTNLVVYRTTDGGRTWRPYVVPLRVR